MNRDKRTVDGRKRYARRVGDQVALLAACSCPKTPEHWAVCPLCKEGACCGCDGANLTDEEKRGVVPPG